MKAQRTLLTLATLTLLAAPSTPVAAQSYECTTTTRTTIRTTTYSDGMVIITTIIVQSTVCVPL